MRSPPRLSQRSSHKRREDDRYVNTVVPGLSHASRRDHRVRHAGARPVVRLDFRQASPGEVSMPLIGLTVVLALSLAFAPVIAAAQQSGKVYRIGFLGARSGSDGSRFLEAFRQGLIERGWVEGKNITIDYRFAEGKGERLPDLAAELLREKVEVVVVEGRDTARAVQQMSNTIPIVMAEATAPVEYGLIKSLARPGGNITGSAFVPFGLTPKLLALLKEVVPGISRVAVLWNPRELISAHSWKAMQLPARQLGVQLHSLEAESPRDWDKAFNEATKVRAHAVM